MPECCLQDGFVLQASWITEYQSSDRAVIEAGKDQHEMSARSGFRVQGSAFRVQGSGFRVQGSGLRARGSGLRVQGSGMGFGWLAGISKANVRLSSWP